METMPIEKIIEIGVQVGVREALERIKREKDQKAKSRYDRRLRNTDLLLRNYKNFVAHCKNAVYTKKQIQGQNAVDILDECEGMDEETYVQAVQRTKERTAIIINHVKLVMAFYKFSTERGNDQEYRKYKVINGIYFEGKTYKDLAEELYCSTKTIERDRNAAIAELSTLIFGVDGLKLEA